MSTKPTEIYAQLRKELDERLNNDKKLKSIAKKIKQKKADFKDTSEYSQIVARHISELIQEKVGTISSYSVEFACKVLLKDHYAAINGVLGEVQAVIDEKNNIHITPQRAAFPRDRIDRVAHSLTDPTVPAEVIKRRAGAPVENVANSFHDDYMHENAKFRSDAGIKCYITRITDGNCCSWCSSLAGRYEYDFFTMPEDIFRRHDNCGCVVICENGRTKQNVWSKRSWSREEEREYLKELDEKKKAERISAEQAKKLQEKNLPKSLTSSGNGGIIESELGKFKKTIRNDNEMTDEYYNAVKNRFSHGSDDAKAVFNKYVHGGSVENAYYTGTPHFDPSTGKISMNYNLDLKNERGKCVTWFHEHGHYIDNAAGNISNNPEFRKLLGDDYLAYMKSYGKYNNLKTVDKVQAAISSELSSMRKHSAVSDIMQGISMGNIQGIAGHSYGYWKDDSVICSEAFAHMFESQFDQIRYKEMQKYFPNALGKFEEMIGGLL